LDFRLAGLNDFFGQDLELAFASQTLKFMLHHSIFE
jgi:hypothetical protein